MSREREHKDGVTRKELLTGKTNSKKGVVRRGVLKGFVGSVATALGFAGTSAGRTETNQISRVTNFSEVESVKEYENVEAMREVLSDHEDMLEVLDKKSLIDSSSVEKLSFESSNPKEGEYVETKQINGRTTPEIKLFRETSQGHLTIGVQPETGDRYAILTVGSEPEVIQEVTTSGCSDSCCDEVLVCCDYERPCSSCPKECVYYCYRCGNCDCNLSCASHCV